MSHKSNDKFPTTVASILDDSLQFLLQAPQRALSVQFLLLSVIVATFSVLVTLPTQTEWQNTAATVSSSDLMAPLITFLWMMLWSIPLWLIQAIIELAMLAKAHQTWMGSDEKYLPDFRAVKLSLVLRLIGLNIWMSLMSVLLLLLLIVPGIIYIVHRIPAAAILVIENKPVFATLHRSKTLMTQRSAGGWKSSPSIRVSGIFLVIFIASIFIGLINPSSLVVEQSLVSPLSLTLLVAANFASLLLTAFRALAIVGFYHDLCARFDGVFLIDNFYNALKTSPKKEFSRPVQEALSHGF
jgi:hypothetical protein